MGRDKALLPFASSTFIEHLAATLDGEVAPLIVVLGHHANEIEQKVHLPWAARVIRNPDYPLGQLSSLHAALRSIENSADVEGALVCLVDHPGVSKEVVQAMLQSFRDSPAAVVIPTWLGRRGHPVLFARSLFQELLAAPLSEGARAVVHHHGGEVRYLKVDEEGITWDIDRPEDYKALCKRVGLAHGNNP
jgi:molybdenum cofactor cytidylyltransferase